MAADDARARYLRDRVLTATPAQRVVMLYDRLALDLGLASAVGTSAVGTSAVNTSAVDTDRHAVAAHLSHALEVVAELHASLDLTAGGPAQNLSSIYTYLLGELLAARGGELERLPALSTIIATLRAAWAQAAEQIGAEAAAAAPAGAWVG